MLLRVWRFWACHGWPFFASALSFSSFSQFVQVSSLSFVFCTLDINLSISYSPLGIYNVFHYFHNHWPPMLSFYLYWPIEFALHSTGPPYSIWSFLKLARLWQFQSVYLNHFCKIHLNLNLLLCFLWFLSLVILVIKITLTFRVP